MEPLTDRQQQVLDYISAYINQHECPPTLREISEHIGTAGTVSAMRHLEALERKGYVNSRDGSIGIALVGRSSSVAVPILTADDKGSQVISPAWRPEGIRSIDVH